MGGRFDIFGAGRAGGMGGASDLGRFGIFGARRAGGIGGASDLGRLGRLGAFCAGGGGAYPERRPLFGGGADDSRGRLATGFFTGRVGFFAGFSGAPLTTPRPGDRTSSVPCFSVCLGGDLGLGVGL